MLLMWNLVNHIDDGNFNITPSGIVTVTILLGVILKLNLEVHK